MAGLGESANMDGWSLLLLLAAAYWAVITLMRFMKRRHDVLLSRLRNAWMEERARRVEEERRRRREERKRRLNEQIQKQLEQSSDRAA